jgi:hypothetical protein
MSIAFDYPEYIEPEQRKWYAETAIKKLDEFEQILSHLYCIIPKEEIKAAIIRGVSLAYYDYDLPDSIFIPHLEGIRSEYEREVNLVRELTLEYFIDCLIKECSPQEVVDGIYDAFLRKEYITPFVEKCYPNLKKELARVVPSIVREWQNLLEDKKRDPNFSFVKKRALAKLFGVDRFRAEIEPLFDFLYAPLNEYYILWDILEFHKKDKRDGGDENLQGLQLPGF